MARVTAADVRAVMQSTSLSDDDLSLGISVASMRVTEEVVPAAVYSEERLTRLEQYLAAHYASTADPSTETEQVGPITIRYEGGTDEMKTTALGETRYGRRARELDTDGILDSPETEAQVVSLGTKADWAAYYSGYSSYGGPL